MNTDTKTAPHAGSISPLLVYNRNIPAVPFILLGLIFCAAGGAAIITVFAKGHEALYGVTRQMPWGLLIATYAYFVITSTGIAFIGGLAHAFGYEKYAALSRRTVVLATVVLLAGFTQILMELGSPLRMIQMMISPNFSAPIFWMGVFYGIELVILAVELIFVFRPGNHTLAAVTGFLALLVGVLATSNLGFVFGSLGARAWYSGAYFSLFLVVSGVTAGAALLILTHFIVYKGKAPAGTEKALASLGKLMGGGIGVMMLLYLWKMVSSLFAGHGDGYAAAYALIKGPLSMNFWVGEILLAVLIPLLLVVTSGGRLKNLALAGLVYMLGLFFTRYDFVLAGQIPAMRGGFFGAGVVPDVSGLFMYSPSAAEWLVFMFGLGVFLLLYFSAEKFLDLETENIH